MRRLTDLLGERLELRRERVAGRDAGEGAGAEGRGARAVAEGQLELGGGAERVGLERRGGGVEVGEHRLERPPGGADVAEAEAGGGGEEPR